MVGPFTSEHFSNNEWILGAYHGLSLEHPLAHRLVVAVHGLPVFVVPQTAHVIVAKTFEAFMEDWVASLPEISNKAPISEARRGNPLFSVVMRKNRNCHHGEILCLWVLAV